MSAVAVAAVVAVASMLGPTAASAEGYPGDFPPPTRQQLAASVQTWDPSHSIQTWDVADSVTPLIVEREDASDVVLTLTNDVLFAFGKSEIASTAADAISDEVRKIPDGAAVSVNGYTDSVGDSAGNLVLSEQRAKAVAAIIESVRPDLVLTVKGYGEDDPVADNERHGEDNPEGRRQNRRVEIRYAQAAS